jgi:hypothetical protein
MDAMASIFNCSRRSALPPRSFDAPELLHIDRKRLLLRYKS